MSMNTNDIMPPNYYNDSPCIRKWRTPPPSTGGGEDEVTTRNQRSRIGQWTSKLVSRFSAAAMTATLQKGRDKVENIRTKMKRQFKFLRAGPILAAAFFFEEVFFDCRSYTCFCPHLGIWGKNCVLGEPTLQGMLVNAHLEEIKNSWWCKQVCFKQKFNIDFWKPLDGKLHCMHRQVLKALSWGMPSPQHMYV